MSNIVETVESFLKNYNIWRSEEPLCVGFSGGFDSMLLQFTLITIGEGKKAHKKKKIVVDFVKNSV